MNKKILAVIGITALAFYINQQIQKSKKIMFKILKIKPILSELAYYNFEKLPLEAKVKLINPTDLTLKVNSLNVQLFYKGVNLTTAFRTELIEIRAKGETIINLNLLIDIVNLSANIRDLLNAFFEGSGTEIKIKGFIDTNIGRLQLNEIYKF
jgi:LEA14-like dessication related protein